MIANPNYNHLRDGGTLAFSGPLGGSFYVKMERGSDWPRTVKVAFDREFRRLKYSTVLDPTGLTNFLQRHKFKAV